MAQAHDWVSPVLWGEPWFEKPPLLYWLTGLGVAAGLPADLACRVPVAILSVLFLTLFWLILHREMGVFGAFCATFLLASSAGWVAFSQVGATDLPLAATFSATMLLGLHWLQTGDRRARNAAGIFLGLAVLAKGLVPLVLVLPLFWFARLRWREAFIPLSAAFVVAAPWYILMSVKYGRLFLEEFFWKHHFQRFTTDVLQHRQPVWFYVPVLLAGLFPWFLFIFLALRHDVRKAWVSTLEGRFALAWLGFGFIFFSLSANKLPGYILPLLPAAAILLALAWQHAGKAPLILGGSVLLLSLVPVIATVLPEALVNGLSRANWGDLPWEYVAILLPVALLAAWLEHRGLRRAALGVALAATAIAIVWLKLSVYPVLDRYASARTLWMQVEPKAADTCVESLGRTMRYGLNFYSGDPLPDCAAAPRTFHIRQTADRSPEIVSDAPTATPAPSLR